MPNLRQLLADHDSLLVLDAASSRIQVGLLSSGESPRWAQSDTEAGRGLFTCVEELGLNPNGAAALVFCEGPGSILGIRTTAMTVRTWNIMLARPIYSYSSLNLVAHAINRPDAAIIADARRESWHCQVPGKPLRKLPRSELAGELIMPEGFRHWSALPDNLQMTSYDLAAIMPTITEANLFARNESPDAFMHSEPEYVTWTPQIHRAP
ncbi:MAG: peptidase M22 [Cephaloticoccus sp.]|nr:peptidase M22 [Cephaloticoccus sp.]